MNNNDRATKFCLLPFAFCLLCALPAFAKTTLHKPISTGKDYYIVFPKAAWGNQSVGVLINSPTKQKITVTTPTGAKGVLNITNPRTTRYYAGQFRIQSEPGVVRKSEATRIQSPNPMSVHGQFGVAGISGTFTALPVTSWGKEYYAIDAPEGTNADYYYWPTIYSVPMITLIAAYPNTIVTFTPTAPTSAGDSIGAKVSITLNRGDVYNITTSADPKAKVRVESPCQNDLSGTHIIATQPIGVMVSQSHTTVPCGYNECGDYGVEWLTPVSNWDSEFVVAPSVQRLNNQAGELLRMVFAYDSTTLTIDDGVNAPRIFGTYKSGAWVDYPNSIGNGIVLTGSHPFLPVLMTTKPVACQAGTSGGENWAFGMVMVNGVHQWSDYVPFSSAIGSQSIANIACRYDQLGHLRVNGKPVIGQFQNIRRLGKTYAIIPVGMNSGTFNEIAGDSGATAGGEIWGYGTARFTPNSGSGDKVQDPEVIKSFSHPINISSVPFTSQDNIAPSLVDSFACGIWNATAQDTVARTVCSGIMDIALLQKSPPDTSFNVTFSPAPAFAYGDMKSTFGIEVINLSQPAQAAVHVRDMAGNEFDTVLVFTPELINAVPNNLDVGAIRSSTKTTGMITLFNRSAMPVTFFSYRLKYGASRHWSVIAPPTVPSSPTAPFTIAANDSINFYFRYDAPAAFEFDNDTLFVTTCREFSIASLLGAPKTPAIFTECYDFGNAVIDTLGSVGDTLSSSAGNGVWVTSVGTDTLHITGISIVGSITPSEAEFPASDFSLGKKFYKVGVDEVGKKKIFTFTNLPTAGKEWILAAQETAFVEVVGHPRYAGIRGGGTQSESPRNYAYVNFENDANHLIEDHACLTMKGIIPPIVAGGINYGARLYGTTADSFFIVRNLGPTDFHINKNGFDHGDSPDSASFELHPYRDPVNNYFYGYDLYDTAGLRVRDSVLVPYRFIAKNVGARSDTIVIVNSSPEQPSIILTARVIQPRIDGISACIPDTVHVGDTISTFMMLHNAGDALLNIDSLEFGGARSDEWTITSVGIPGSNLTLTSPPWKFPLRSTNDSTGEKAYVFLKWIPTTDSAPSAVVRVIGMDSLHRHASDSASATFYKWNVFPYDTVMPIVNLPCLTGVSNQHIVAPTQDILWPNYPNPFSSSTTLGYTLGSSGHVMLRMVNALGETVAMLVNEHQASGTYSVTAKGAGLRAGMYFVELICSGERTARKIIIVQ